MFKKLFSKEKEIDNREFRRAIYHFSRWFSEKINIHYIVNVKTIKTKNQIKVIIETHFPGLLIGKKGEVIKLLEAFIQEDVGIKKGIIIVEVVESKLWMNLYR
jgi:ribosomal protein S3